MSYRFRHAICNEVYQKWAFSQACKSIRKIGYTGIEIAPFTLAEDPAKIPAALRAECRSIMQSEGLQFVGLHWLMVSPAGLHVTTPDPVVRKRSWDHVRNLVDLCADLGSGGVMVFGSPKQRRSTGGLSPAQATRHFVDGIASVAGHAHQQGVTLLIEALPKGQDNDIVNLLDEAVALVKQINSPAVRTMFDTHNAADETEPHASLVDRYFDLIRHIHVNEMDGKHPGQGNYDFKSILRVLARRGYQGWISLEAFDFTPGSETIASQSLRHLEAEIAKLEL